MGGTCADYLKCVREDPENPFNLRGTCQRTVAACCDRKVKKSTGQVYVVDKEMGTGYCLEGCAYRKKGVARSPVYCLGSKWDSHRFECQREPRHRHHLPSPLPPNFKILEGPEEQPILGGLRFLFG